MKKEIFIPALLGFLGLGFIIINIIVYFSRGNAWFIKKKLKVGALILTLTSIAACHTIPQPTCYDVAAPSNEFNDSTANTNKKDSIYKADKQKQKNDSIANINKIRMDSIRPTCYEMPAPKNDKPPKK